MKAALKRISSVIMAFAVVISLTPVTGQMILADETDTDTPAVTAESDPEKDSGRKDSDGPESGKPKEAEKEKSEEPKETEAPKAEADEPKETEKTEADVPEETEKPVSETPKETDKPEADTPGETETKGPEKQVTNTPKKAPITVGKITANLNQSTGMLTWKDYSGAHTYFVKISDAAGAIQPGENSLDLKLWIDTGIADGSINKQNSYTIKITAEDKNLNVIAEWKGSFSYNSSETSPKTNEIKNVTITNKGDMTWDDYSGAKHYDLYINGAMGDSYQDWNTDPEEVNVHEIIDKLIRAGEVDKGDTYSVRLEALNDKCELLAKFSKTISYRSSATRATKYTFEKVKQTKTIISWDKIPNVSHYDMWVSYDDGHNNYCGWMYGTTNKFDINNELSRMIDEEGFKLPKSCTLTYELVAYDKNETRIARCEGTIRFNVSANPLSVSGKKATVKYKKLKKKKQTLDISQVINGVDTGRGTITFTKVKGNKKISINSTTGKVTIKKKGLKKKKTYKVTVKIKAAGNNGYRSAVKTVTFRIRVK